jgi:hypothetical protein
MLLGDAPNRFATSFAVRPEGHPCKISRIRSAPFVTMQFLGFGTPLPPKTGLCAGFPTNSEWMVKFMLVPYLFRYR